MCDPYLQKGDKILSIDFAVAIAPLVITSKAVGKHTDAHKSYSSAFNMWVNGQENRAIFGTPSGLPYCIDPKKQNCIHQDKNSFIMWELLRTQIYRKLEKNTAELVGMLSYGTLALFFNCTNCAATCT